MKFLINKPHLIFLLSIPIIMLIGILSGDTALDINVHDTYYIIAYLHIAILISILFGIIGLISILYAGELSRPDGLAFGFCIAYSCFWIWRLVWQFTYQVNVYDINPDHIEPVKIIFPSAIAISYVYPVFLKIVF
jgi:cytochrome c oxidase subunit 1